VWKFFIFLWIYTRSIRLLGRVIGPSEALYLNTGQHKRRINAHTHTQTHTPNIHALSRIRTHDHSVRASEDNSCLRPLDHRDRPKNIFSSYILSNHLIEKMQVKVVMQNIFIIFCRVVVIISIKFDLSFMYRRNFTQPVEQIWPTTFSGPYHSSNGLSPRLGDTRFEVDKVALGRLSPNTVSSANSHSTTWSTFINQPVSNSL
jgi:hypothetical protein